MKTLLVLASFTSFTSFTWLASADDRVGTSMPVGGLELSITVEPTDLSATLALRNVSMRPLKVLSHVKTHEIHYDWFEIEVTWPKADKDGKCTGTGKLVLQLSDSRDKSVEVVRKIASGRSLAHKLSIPAWAAREANGAITLGGSYYKIVARYRVKQASSRSGAWNGELVTTPARVLGLDQMRNDVCAHNPGWNKF